jgi:hypothetical protein
MTEVICRRGKSKPLIHHSSLGIKGKRVAIIMIVPTVNNIVSTFKILISILAFQCHLSPKSDLWVATHIEVKLY